MAITYYMLQISSVYLFLMIVGGGAIFGAISTVLFRKFVRLKVKRSHNEVTGFLFLAIASFYALLLSFVVLVVWQQLYETMGIVSKEGSSAQALYRDIKYYPDTVQSQRLKAVYMDFVFDVVDEEFPRMAHMERTRVTSQSFDRVYEEMRKLTPKDAIEELLVAKMLAQLGELTNDRGQRIATMEMEVPPPMWLPMILGAFITLLCAMMLDIEHIRMHIWLNTLLGAFIGMFLFVIIYLDHPYAGKQGIQPTSYLQIFTSEQWALELHQERQLRTQ